MRHSRPPLYLILLFVVLPSLLIFGRSSGLLDSSTRASEPAGLDPVAALFEAERYADAEALLADSNLPPGRGTDFYRLATARQLAHLRGQIELAREQGLQLLRFAEEEDDRWAALAVTQLLRPFEQEHAGAMERLVAKAIAYWQRSVELEDDAPLYADLFEAMLQPGPSYRMPLLDMWVDLEGSPLPRERLYTLGRQLLTQRAGPHRPLEGALPYLPPHHLYYRVADSDALRRRAANDLLAAEPEAWLRAICEFTLGEVAESRGEFRAAVQHFEAALRAEPTANSSASTMAELRLKAIVTPSVQLNGPALYQPESLHQLSLQWRNLSGWTLRIDAIDPNSLRPVRGRLPYSLKELQSADPGRVATTRSEEDGEERAAREEGARTQPHVPRHEELWLDPLPAGLYRATLSGAVFVEDEAGPSATIYFMVTELGLLMQPVGTRDAEEIELWLVNMRSGKPLAGTELRVMTGTGRRAQEVRWTETTRTTDADGVLRVPAPTERVRSLLATAHAGGQPVFLAHANLRQAFRSEQSTDAAFVLSDRPLYRPGETVHLQAFLRSRDPAQRRVELPSAHESVWLFVHSADGAELLRRELELDANATVETSFSLPADAALGRYSLQLRWQESGNVFGAGSIQVDEVRLPEFRVETDFDGRGDFVIGERIRVSVRAEYLFGGPVSGAGEYVVRRGSSYQPMLHGGRAAMFPPRYGATEEFARGSFVLDGSGIGSFEFLADAGSLQDEALEFQVEARITDSSRREVVSERVLRIGRAAFRASLQPTRWVVAPGDRVRVDLRLEDFDGEPVGARVELRAWQEKGALREDLSEAELAVADGAGVFEFEAKQPGRIQVELFTADARGRSVTAQTSLWCADPEKSAVVEGEGGLTLVTERDRFDGDGPARVLLFSSYPNAAVRVVRAHAGAVVSEIHRLDGSMKILEFPIDDLHRPGFPLHASLARDFRLWTAQIQVETPPAKRRLDLNVEFEQENHGPGDEATLRVRVLDADGNPSRGPVTLAVIDASILEVVPRNLPDPLEYFYSFAPVTIPPSFDSGQQLGGYLLLDEEYVDARSRDEWRQRPSLGKAEFDAEGFATPMRLAEVAAEELPASAPMELKGGRAGAGVGEDPVIRRDFRTTALWRTAVFPDGDGSAELRFPLPETLGEWNALAVAVDGETRCGMAEATTRTYKPLQLRLNHPRVFRERDRVLFSGTVHNDSDRALVCTVSLSADPLRVEEASRDLIVEAHSIAEVSWWADVEDGSASLEFERDAETGRLSVWPDRCLVRGMLKTSAGGDAFERVVELIPFGTALDVSVAAELRGNGSLSLELPDERVASAERATLTLAPTVLSACFEVLPYLAEYPYGCTEQTLSRFVPAAAVRHVARQFGKSARSIDPALDDKIRSGLRRIADFQHADGGWGWWKEDSTDPYMTSYVLIALSEAAESGVRIDGRMLQRGREALRDLLPQMEGHSSNLAYALYALAAADQTISKRLNQDELMERQAGWLFERRAELTDMGRALLAIYLHRAGEASQADDLLGFLRNTMQRNDDYETLHWGQRSGFVHRSLGAVETTSFALRALLEIAPSDTDIEGAARWLVQNRRAGRWDNTRASAHAIYALCDYSSAREDFSSSYGVRASIGDVEIASMRVDADNVFDLDTVFPFDPALLGGDRSEIRIEMDGEGVCYASTHLSTYSRSEDPEPTENWIGVEREIVRLMPALTLGGDYRQVETPLEEGAALQSGDRLRVKLRLNAHSDLEYLAIEDPRPAGAEPVDALSGWFSSGGISGRREVRDEMTGFFVRRLSEGEHTIEYDLRVESPGSYFAMPVLAYAMYVPDVSGSSRLQSMVFVAGE